MAWPYTVPADVLAYFRAYHPEWDYTQAAYSQDAYSGQRAYRASDGNWYMPQSSDEPAQRGYVNQTGFRSSITPGELPSVLGGSDVYFDASGNFTHTYVNEKMADLDLVLAMAGSAVGMAALFGGAFAGAGVSGFNGATSAAIPSSLSVAGDAYLPGALGPEFTGPAWGTVLPGLESYVLPAAAATTAASAATTAAKTASLASSATSLLSTAAKAAGTLLSLTASKSAPVSSSPQPVTVIPSDGGLAGIPGSAWLVAGAVIVGAIALPLLLKKV